MSGASMPNQLFLPGDENDVPENVTPIEFYQRASAVLGLIKWVGPATMLVLIGALVWLVTPK
jgi:hypothetical protein